MARNYALRLEKYGISRALFQKLQGHCRMYPEKVAELCVLRGGFSSFELQDTPKGSAVGDPTGRRALRALKLEAEMSVIEQAAIAASPELYPYILDNVTRQVRFELLEAPCGKNQFSAVRTRFYVNLAVAMGEIGELGATES